MESFLTMLEHLFVYGTLAPGRSNEHLLENLSGKWRPATIQGRLTRGVRGSARGYPGVLLEDTENEVEGLLFSSTDLTRHWQRLDAFEGNGYERRTTMARLYGGKAVPAHIYTLR